jgi:hypothetical protein
VYYTPDSQLVPHLDMLKLTFNIQLVEFRANLSVDLDSHDTPFLMQDTAEIYSKDIDVYVTMSTGTPVNQTDFDSQLQLAEFFQLDNQFKSVTITQEPRDIPGFKVLELTKQSSPLLQYKVQRVHELDLSNLLTDKVIFIIYLLIMS